MPVIPFFLANTTTLDTVRQPLLILNERQTNLLSTIERGLGSVSLVAVALIFVAFGLFRPLRTVPNCFLVCSSVNNVFSSAATLVAQDGLRMTVTNGGRGLCNAQGFLFQMFLQSDPWWSFAMAVNVLIIFRYGADPRHFRRWWWLYCLICYGGPGVSAVVLLALGYYGNAGIWCWIDSSHQMLRIYAQYLPVWICILGTLLIYLGLGIHVFRSRNDVDKQFPLRASPEHPPILQPIPRDRKSFLSLSDWPLSPFTSSALFPDSPDGTHPLAPMPMSVSRAQSSHTRNSRSIHTRPSRSIRTQYSRSTRRTRGPLPTRAASVPSKRSSNYMRAFGLNPRRAPSPPPTLSEPDEPSATHVQEKTRGFWHIFTIDDPTKRPYLQTAGLFAFAIFATWLPSNIYSIKQILSGSDANFAAYAASTAALSTQGIWNFLIFFFLNRRALISCAKHRLSGTPDRSRISALLDNNSQQTRPAATTIHVGTQTEPAHNNIGLAESADIAIETKSIRTLPEVITEIHHHHQNNPLPVPEKLPPNPTAVPTPLPSAYIKPQPSKRSLRPALKEKLSSTNIRRDLTVRIPWRSQSRTSNWSLSTTGRNKKEDEGSREGSQRSYSWDFLDIGLETRGNVLAAISSRGTPTGSGGGVSPVTVMSRGSVQHAGLGHTRGVSSPC
ncbi:hypothetical protein QBC40DRAFT_332193 [Triangularia verruculosa]|uniref:G-protein coupled receptors family 2 profile 2 domain-containing protein n=1 Tax=Triangularia verruculosa TaxID=2587418 RepID=A0AAN7AUH2_9PEZI|nr:hypothetical protein QBC40DRAFT_332193 [Triangularia verruculosa]